ncbi:helix-turn-helix transcriptional regulator [Pseudomonas sp. LJDD11]|uniref:helix-turn-helix transcriptional regulator n=1 Tax=unclassified Pseudomonas TaxID=196821 RepID=UPI0004F663BE|nr:MULTISPECIES: helix-turn-helix transcriptional regulator [unclassified Pseudomonas]MCQ9427108.1 helix-turn-helix transcriptional regulator [Pseudomonas sp. LJDD11]BAP45366.1 CheY sensor protein [Pseudomonas sp. StFLB209]
MNSRALFPHLGKVIASTGSRHFPRMLHDLIHSHLAIDATHIRRLPLDPVQQASSPDEIDFCASAHAEQTPTASHTEAAQLHLSRHKDGFRYEISLYRSREPQGFSAQERTLLQDISPLLLPMVEKHISAVQPADTQAPVDDSSEPQTLRLRFIERLQQSGLKLSAREMEVCVGLLAGRTAPELAVQLDLKVNTIESYLKRASIKLGISGRHSLKRWMYSADDTPLAGERYVQ